MTFEKLVLRFILSCIYIQREFWKSGEVNKDLEKDINKYLKSN